MNLHTEKYYRRNRRRKLWHRIVSCLACVVVFVTTYALILPAITVEKTAECGKEEHQHTDSCYEERLICGKEETEGHKHTDSCYTVTYVLDCELEEHTHSENCYDENGNLICSIPEHTHDSGCYHEEKELTCGLEESEGHTHTAECYEKVLVCGKEAHVHTASCYAHTAEQTAEEKEDSNESDSDEIGSGDNSDASGTSGTSEEAADSAPQYTDGALTFEGPDYTITASYNKEACIPDGSVLSVTEITREDESYEEYRDQAEKAMAENAAAEKESSQSETGSSGEESVEKVTWIRLFDISILNGDSVIEPAGPVSVQIIYKEAIERNDHTDVKTVHFEGEKEVPRMLDTETKGTETSVDEVTFDTDSFSVFAIIGTTIEKNVLASDGNNYKISVTYTADAGIPDGADLEVSELTGELYDEYVGLTAGAMDAIGFEYARIFDISIVDKDGDKIQPASAVNVSVELLDDDVSSEAFSVIHFSGEEETPEEIDAQTEGNVVSFSTESFSAYAIVQGPAAIPLGWTKISSLDDLAAYISEGEGLYIGQTSGYYLKNNTTTYKSNSNIQGIEKTGQKDYPGSDASLYYFEQVEGTDNQFYIYCYDDSGNKTYVYNTDADSLYLDQETKSAYTVTVKNGSFSFSAAGRYWNMWGGAGGNIFAAYTKLDNGGYFYLWNFDGDTDADPYGLDGTTYGLMNWTEGTTGKALMANSQTANHLDGLALTVMSTTNNSSTLFVPDDSDISMWTFHFISDDLYYLTAEVDGSTKYLKITSSGISLVDEPDNNCKIKVVPGSGTYAGKICLKSGNTTLTYSGDITTGFSVGGSSGSEWLNLVELSELTSDYFMTYSASKVSVSDPSVTNASRIIVYTRVWNDTTKKYEFYAVDHDGSLVRCYESGDSIEWVGSRLNSMLWNFVEYYEEGTDTPNYYYELYNQYSEKYIAPQVSDGQILSDSTIGINLNGRKNGQYYSTILAWDDDNYSYAGLKADVDTGKVVSCTKADADDFYFAIMQDIPVDDRLTTVSTVDNDLYGITMKMVNFDNRNNMSNFLGSDNGYKNGNTESGLLSTELGSDGYPTTKANNSLSDWFADADEVNHLFIASTYNATGYFEYDSVQNFAHLDQSSNDFVVYKQIGTTDTAKGKFYTHGQFFPYNDLTAGKFATQKNLTDALGRTLSDSDPRKYEQLYHIQNPAKPDYYMGMEVEASFTQTPDGLDDWGHDIIYEFTGDDDFWLYVDGELIIDLGGIHDALAGSVNYRTGDVYVNGTHTTLKDLFYNNYISRGHTAAEAQEYVDGIFTKNSEGNYIFKDYTAHTMKIFYLERGAGASNLHMRFNLASITPGTVQLSKALSGVDSTESVLAEFPYQIVYRTVSGGDTEYNLTNSLPPDYAQTEDYVVYKGTTTPVTYQQSLTVDGIEYNDVFLLKPGEVAEISFPDDMTDYRIIECGINTNVYDSVTANGSKVTGTSGENYPSNRKDFGIDYASTDDRARVVYTNDVNPEALRTLTITKELFKEDGITEITNEEDGTGFNFQLYLGTEFGDLDPANMHTYHVKNPDGNYCTWDVTQQTFVSTGKTDYSTLTDEEKTAASFTTSMNGRISKIPTGYTVEIRNILAGTQFKATEPSDRVPDGYSFQKYVYNKEGYSGNTTDADTGVTDTVEAGQDSHVDVCNLKGWGLRVNKVWSDADYMSSREAAYFAVYTGPDEDNLTLVSSPNTVRQMKYGETTLYWYFLPLPVDLPFDQYWIREVTISNTSPTVDSDGYVSDPGTVTAVEEGGTVRIEGRQKGETGSSEFPYTVLYTRGTVEQDSNVRVDTVTNNRPGIVLKKEDWSGNALAGAVFTLKDPEGDLIGTFTSDSEGLITVAFLRDNIEYTLTEKTAPDDYHGLEESMTILLNNGTVSVTGVSEDYYELEQKEGGTPTLTIKNRPYTLKAVKKDADTDALLQGVTFALHKQHTVDVVTSIDPNPMSGYEALVTGQDGTIPGIDNTLPVGTYELREKAALDGYQLLPSYIRFTISTTGEISLGIHPDGVTLDTEISVESGELSYTLTIPNSQKKKVSIWKTDPDHNVIKTGASFALYKAADYDDDTETPITGATPLLTGTTGTNGILSLGELLIGEYRLVETSAPDGFDLETSAIKIFVSADQVTAMQGASQAEVARNTADNAYRKYWVPGQDNATWQIRVWNNPGVELPYTGGPGKQIFMIPGLLLIIASGILLIRRHRSIV